MDNKETKIYVIRHGQSEGNLKRQILGHTDLELTELGQEQAEKCAEFLKDVKVDAIYSSDLLRAYHTARPHAVSRGIKIQTSEQLRELYFGDWDGAMVSSVENTDMFQIGWRENFGTFTAPSGESVPALAERVYKFIEEKAIQNPGKTLMFVFHAAAIRSFWGKISGVSFEKLAQCLVFPENASVSLATYKNGKFTPINYSVSSFLK